MDKPDAHDLFHNITPDGIRKMLEGFEERAKQATEDLAEANKGSDKEVPLYFRSLDRSRAK